MVDNNVFLAALLQGVPVNFPKRREGRGKLEMSPEARKARLVREALLQEMNILFDRATRRFPDIHTLPLAAFLTAYLNAHVLP